MAAPVEEIEQLAGDGTPDPPTPPEDGLGDYLARGRGFAALALAAAGALYALMGVFCGWRRGTHLYRTPDGQSRSNLESRASGHGPSNATGCRALRAGAHLRYRRRLAQNELRQAYRAEIAWRGDPEA